MKLLTKEIIKRVPKTGTQQNVTDPMVYAKFFTPWSRWTWYLTEMDDPSYCFGYCVSGMCKEFNKWGYFSLEELSEIRGIGGLKVERDLSFSPKPFSQCGV